MVSSFFRLYGILIVAGLVFSGCNEKTAQTTVKTTPTQKITLAPANTDGVTILEEDTQTSSPDGEMHYQEGLNWSKQKEHDKAIALFTEAIKSNPFNAKYYNQRGLSYTRKKELDLGIADLTKAIDLDPKNTQYYNNRALIYYEKRDFDKCWADVHAKAKLGGQMNPNFLQLLKLASQRDE